MKLHIITIGEPKLAFAKQGWQTYLKRLQHYHQVRVSHIADKRPGAFVVTRRTLSDAATGQDLAVIEQLNICRGDGGYSKGDAALSDTLPEPIPAPPAAPPDGAVIVPDLIVKLPVGQTCSVVATSTFADDASVSDPELDGPCPTPTFTTDAERDGAAAGFAGSPTVAFPVTANVPLTCATPPVRSYRPLVPTVSASARFVPPDCWNSPVPENEPANVDPMYSEPAISSPVPESW